MDASPKVWYFVAMTDALIPSWNLYGEVAAFPDYLHVERVVDRAAGLDWTIAAHRHLHLHQVFLLSHGDIRMTLDGAAVTITPPAAINLPRGTVHGFWFSAGTEGYVVTLPADDFADLFAAPSETAGPLGRVFVGAADAGVVSGFDRLAAVHAGQSRYRRTRLRAAVTGLLALIAEGQPGDGTDRAALDPRVQRFQDMVRRNLGRTAGLAGVAQQLGLSPRHLNRLCLAGIGMTAVRYIEATRMREACRLLVYTRMTAQQIGYQLGFDDPSYFSRVFQRNLALSPTAYRARFEG